MSRIIKAEPGSVGASFFVRMTADPFILMLALGGLSHQLNKPQIAIGFWPCLLLVIAIQSISPSHVTKWKIEEDSKL